MSDARDAVYAAAAEIYKPAGVIIWMRSPNPHLGGETPLQRVDAGRADTVLAVLDAMATGAVM